MSLSSDQLSGLYSVMKHAFEILRDTVAFNWWLLAKLCGASFLRAFSRRLYGVQVHPPHIKDGMFEFRFMLSCFLLHLSHNTVSCCSDTF